MSALPDHPPSMVEWLDGLGPVRRRTLDRLIREYSGEILYRLEDHFGLEFAPGERGQFVCSLWALLTFLCAESHGVRLTEEDRDDRPA